MLSSKINAYIMLFAIYLDGTVHISELFWKFLSFIHNNRIIMGGGGHFFLSTHCMLGRFMLNIGPNSAVSIVFSIITNSNNAIVPVTNEGLSSHMVVYGKIRTYTHAEPNYCISEGNHMENELYSAVNESPNHV